MISLKFTYETIMLVNTDLEKFFLNIFIRFKIVFFG